MSGQSNHLPDSARVCIFNGPGKPLSIERARLSEPRSDEILVEVMCATLCGSDLHTFTGRRVEPTPCVLGHEILGRVAAFGAGVETLDATGRPLRIGDRVSWSVTVHCGECFYCCHDLPQKCEQLFKYGHAAFDPQRPFAGGLADYCYLLPRTTTVAWNESVTDAVAATASCAAATVAGAIRMGGGCDGEVVLVQGLGMLGLTACALARTQGAARVIGSDPDRARCELALKFGATDVADSSAILESTVREASDGRGADLALELSGARQAVVEGLSLVRTGGRYVLAGSVLPTQPVAIDPQSIVRRMVSLRGVHNYSPVDLIAAVRFLEEHGKRWPFAELIPHAYPLEQTDAAFACALATKRRALRLCQADVAVEETQFAE